MLHMLCGKICAGKSTLATRLAAQPGAVLISEDDWLSKLYGDQMKTIADYGRCSRALQSVMVEHVPALLATGVDVVLDFPANTRAQRAWMKDVLDRSGAEHLLHVLDLPDDVLLARLHARNASGEHPFEVTDAQFEAISKHFEKPVPDEGFTLAIHGEAI
ncbi:AAA family ATPase [Pacificoceanicola onchidii]|uniref:AAA family ATPase n=1 Tax=Pacificoceanicola onchidii TaxID=2562685 RepID=UPI001F10DC13|nr:ATP-binding protein [Pacificoceanicola onchidii]